MMKDTSIVTAESGTRPTLTFANRPPRSIDAEVDLHEALAGLSRLRSGQEVTLAHAHNRYIRAVRHGELWAVTTQRGSYFTRASFTASLTTEYSERVVRESKAAGSMWNRICRAIRSPSPERALSNDQVRTLFTEFFRGSKFSIPQSGA